MLQEEELLQDGTNGGIHTFCYRHAHAHTHPHAHRKHEKVERKNNMQPKERLKNNHALDYHTGDDIFDDDEKSLVATIMHIFNVTGHQTKIWEDEERKK